MRGLLAEIGFESLSGEPSSMTCQVVNMSHSAYIDVVPPRFKTILFATIRLVLRTLEMGILRQVTSLL